jgi:hypothetical protein
MISRYPSIKRLRPTQHDWNDQLRSLPTAFWSPQTASILNIQYLLGKKKSMTATPSLILSSATIRFSIQQSSLFWHNISVHHQQTIRDCLHHLSKIWSFGVDSSKPSRWVRF